MRQQHIAKIQGVLFDTVMAIGIPWLVELTRTPLLRLHDKNARLGDVNLVFQPNKRGEKPIGVSFCNHEPGPLNHRLKRVKKQWEAGRGTDLGTLVVLRFTEERTTQPNEDGLKALADVGVRVIRIDRQQLAELAAFQTLFTKSLDGGLHRNGRIVETAEFQAWAEGNLSDAVKELFHQIFDPESPKPSAAASPTVASLKSKPSKKQDARL